MSTNGANGLLTKVQSALTGVQTVLPTNSSLQINGVTMTQSQIAAQLSGYVPTFTAVATEKQAYAQAVSARQALEPSVRTFLVNLRAALVAFFGRGSLQLTKFGMGTGKPGTVSPTARVIAAAKAQQTRVKRGTTGKKQKLEITVVSPPAVTIGGEPGSESSMLPTVSGTQSVGGPVASAPVGPVSGAVPSPTPPATPAK